MPRKILGFILQGPDVFSIRANPMVPISLGGRPDQAFPRPPCVRNAQVQHYLKDLEASIWPESEHHQLVLEVSELLLALGLGSEIGPSVYEAEEAVVRSVVVLAGCHEAEGEFAVEDDLFHAYVTGKVR